MLLAGWLSHKTIGLSANQKKTALFLFCTAFTGISLYIIISTIVIAKTFPSTMYLRRPLMPGHIGKTNKTIVNAGIAESLYRRIESLKNNDSLLKARPHLIDTIKLIEKLYQSPSKK